MSSPRATVRLTSATEVGNSDGFFSYPPSSCLEFLLISAVSYHLPGGRFFWAREDLLQRGLLHAVLRGAGAAESSFLGAGGDEGCCQSWRQGATTLLERLKEVRQPGQAAGQEAEHLRGQGS